MLDKEEFVEIGYIRKGHGFSGQVRVAVEDRWEQDLRAVDFIFIEIDGYKVPFYIQEKMDHKGLILKLEFIDGDDNVKSIIRSPIFILKKNIKYASLSTEMSSAASDFVAMNIHDKTHGDIGKIIRIDEFPQQEMAILKRENFGEVLIPMHPSLIIKIDKEKGIIHMDLPDGILQLK